MTLLREGAETTAEARHYERGSDSKQNQRARDNAHPAFDGTNLGTAYRRRAIDGGSKALRRLLNDREPLALLV